MSRVVTVVTREISHMCHIPAIVPVLQEMFFLVLHCEIATVHLTISCIYGNSWGENLHRNEFLLLVLIVDMFKSRLCLV